MGAIVLLKEVMLLALVATIAAETDVQPLEEATECCDQLLVPNDVYEVDANDDTFRIEWGILQRPIPKRPVIVYTFEYYDEGNNEFIEKTSEGTIDEMPDFELRRKYADPYASIVLKSEKFPSEPKTIRLTTEIGIDGQLRYRGVYNVTILTRYVDPDRSNSTDMKIFDSFGDNISTDSVVDVIENDPYTFECEANGFSTQPNITWIYGDQTTTGNVTFIERQREYNGYQYPIYDYKAKLDVTPTAEVSSVLCKVEPVEEGFASEYETITELNVQRKNDDVEIASDSVVNENEIERDLNVYETTTNSQSDSNTIPPDVSIKLFECDNCDSVSDMYRKAYLNDSLTIICEVEASPEARIRLLRESPPTTLATELITSSTIAPSDEAEGAIVQPHESSLSSSTEASVVSETLAAGNENVLKFTIKKVKFAHMGTCTCVAENGIGEERKLFRLGVSEKRAMASHSVNTMLWIVLAAVIVILVLLISLFAYVWYRRSTSSQVPGKLLMGKSGRASQTSDAESGVDQQPKCLTRD